jgi:hypothetical protein
MGAYCVFYCWERKEYIDPSDISDASCKPHHVMHHPDVGRVLMQLLVFGPVSLENNPRCLPYGSWPSVRMTADEYPHSPDHPCHEEIVEEWTDVTREAVERYNELGREYEGHVDVRYTPGKENDG